jgi:hypothetical protein
MPASVSREEGERRFQDFIKSPEGIEFSVAVADAVTASLIRSGELDPRGKSKHELYKALAAFVIKKPTFTFSTDYTDTLLETARKFRKQKDSESAILYYAIWCEHVLNHLIFTYGLRMRMRERDVVHLLKDTQFRAKFIWVHLSFAEKFKEIQFHRATLLSSIRNEFIHYKWEGRSDSESEKDKARVKGALEAAEPLVTYLEALTHRHIHRGFKGLKKHRRSRTRLRAETPR